MSSNPNYTKFTGMDKNLRNHEFVVLVRMMRECQRLLPTNPSLAQLCRELEQKVDNWLEGY